MLRDGRGRRTRPRERHRGLRSIVTAKVAADKGDAGIKIVSSALSATVKGLKGIDAQQFDELAKQAEGAAGVERPAGVLQITVTTHVS